MGLSIQALAEGIVSCTYLLNHLIGGLFFLIQGRDIEWPLRNNSTERAERRKITDACGQVQQD